MSEPSGVIDTPRERLLWLDAVKGIGIIAVVFGHVVNGPPARYVYLWHMPLFFFLAGYVFRPEPDFRRCLRDRAVRLLLPYTLFLFLLSGHDFVSTAQSGGLKEWALFVATHLSGGKSVYGWLVAVWFVTCLFLTQQAVNVATVRLAPRAMALLMGASLVLAYVNAVWFPRLWLPWAANVCLFAAPIFYLGSVYRRHEARISPRLLVVAAAFAVLGMGLVGAQLIAVPDMKNTRYGTPLLSLGFALCLAVTLMAAARRWLNRGPLARALAATGEASLVIMFLHMATQQVLLDVAGVQSDIARIVLAVVLPMLVFNLLQRHAVTRALFLGSVKDFEALPSIASRTTQNP